MSMFIAEPPTAKADALLSELRATANIPMNSGLPPLPNMTLAAAENKSWGISKIFADGWKDIQAFKKFREMSGEEQRYILTILSQEALGKGSDAIVDDRKFPFERLMQALASLPPDSDVRTGMSSGFITQFWNDLERPPRVWPAHPFRSADGSGNSIKYPHMGASNTSYARTVTSSSVRLPKDLPDPAKLFDELMARPDEVFVPHPTGVNSLLFYLAGVITHDLFRSDPANPAINKTTHYADISPLYGVNAEEQKKVREPNFSEEKGYGKLKPDYFADPRLQFQVPGIVSLLVVFSRHHNYLADQLLANDADENYRFTRVNGAGSAARKPEEIDELIFQTARLINNQCYGNIILHEYLRTILGLPATTNFTLSPLMTPPAPDPTNGNVCSVEFGFVYRWHSALGEHDAQWLKQLGILDKYVKLRQEMGAAMQNVKPEDPSKPSSFFTTLLSYFGYTEAELALGPVCLGMHRSSKTLQFPDTDLINNLKAGIENVASSLGAQKIPKELKYIEVDGIRNARKLGCCTLNEFRAHFKLEQYKTFEDMNPDPKIAKLLKKFYPTVNDVELYPGLVIEEAKHDGLSLPYTASRAILADAVNLLRNDRFFVDGNNPHDLTVWGYNYVNQTDVPGVGSVFKKMVLNTMPGWGEVVGKGAEEMLVSPFVAPRGTVRN